MRRGISLRILTFLILWTGIFVLKKGEISADEIVIQAVIFTVLVTVGLFIERFFAFKGDICLIPVVEAILAIGLVFLIRIKPEVAQTQFVWANLGLICFYVILFGIKDYRKLGEFKYLWGMAALGLLMITLVFGVTLGGATSWIRIGSVGFEPEELVKVTLLLFLASYLKDNEEILRVGTVQVGKFSLPDKRTLGPFVITAIFVLGLLAAQKSLGTAMVFFFLFVLLIYMVTERIIYLLMAIPMMVTTGIFGYMLFGHVRVRIATWINPWVDSTGTGFQIAQSIFAISGGKLLGTGLGNGIGAYQIPASSTDFIFSVIAEEVGFAGAMAVIFLFIVVVMRAFAVSIRALDRFGQI
ncbi:MAG: FtsW/RodA/SpoVE family cell cycle protein, partial [Eubacteriales bacterium]